MRVSVPEGLRSEGLLGRVEASEDRDNEDEAANVAYSDGSKLSWVIQSPSKDRIDHKAEEACHVRGQGRDCEFQKDLRHLFRAEWVPQRGKQLKLPRFVQCAFKFLAFERRVDLTRAIYMSAYVFIDV